MPEPTSAPASRVTVPDAAKPFLHAATLADLVTCRQVALLHVIAANPGQSVAPLAQALCVSKPAITRASDMLVKHGLVQRDVERTDRRKVRLTPTAEAVRFLAAEVPA